MELCKKVHLIYVLINFFVKILLTLTRFKDYTKNLQVIMYKAHNYNTISLVSEHPLNKKIYITHNETTKTVLPNYDPDLP